MKDKTKKQQQDICKKFKSEFVKNLSDFKIGISESALEGKQPINGLRHPPERDTTGWYIWAGEYSDEPDFFKLIHLKHLLDNEKFNFVVKYLGLAPGWRFLIDDKGYEDVWYDSKLLDVN